MNNIENRIVEMKFDNAQFESAVAKTMETLDRFKEKLNFEGAGKGMDQLGKATGNYQYTLNDIGQSLDQLNGKFSTMGNIGRRVLENLTDSAYGFIQKGIGGMLGGITQGGLSRAMNLEQAKFQMQGIYKDAEKVYDVIYNDILPELMGTPYSLDQAAVVIGQLGASGIKSSEQIHQATRAIAGLAAMSGRGFDEVGRIFSKIAGQGNMMGGELQQLSTYGINAAANLSEYFTKVAEGSQDASDSVKQHVADILEAYEGDLSEASIRDAASNRMIFYEDMAAAMDTLYGEHAKKSTEMYTGALEDLKAALARIGAEPAAVGLEVLRNAFNALVPAVDAVNAVLKPFTNAGKGIVDSDEGKIFGGQMYGQLAKEVQSLGISFANLFVQMDENGKVMRWTSDSIYRYKQSLSHLARAGKEVSDWQKDYADYAAEGDGIMNPQMWRILTNSTQSFVNLLKAFRNVLQPIAQGMLAAFPKVTLETIGNITEKVRDFTKALIFSKDNMARIKDISQAVFTPLGLVLKAIGVGINLVVEVVRNLFNTFKPALTAFLSFAAVIGRLVVDIAEFITKIAEAGFSVGRFAFNISNSIIELFRFDKFVELIQKGFYKLADILDKIGLRKIKDLVDQMGGLGNALKALGGLIVQTLHLDTAFKWLSTLGANIKAIIIDVLHLNQIGTAFQNFVDAIKDLASTDGLLGKLLTNLKNFIDWIAKLVPYETIVTNISNAFGKLGDKVKGLTQGPANKITKFFNKIAKEVKDFIVNLDEGNAFNVIFKDITNNMIPGLKKARNALRDFKTVLIPLLQSFTQILPRVFGFEKMGDMVLATAIKVKNAVHWFGSFIGLWTELSGSKIKSNTEALSKSLKTVFDEKLINGAKDFGDSIGKITTGIGAKLSDIASGIKTFMEKMDPDMARKAVKTLALLLLAFHYIKVMRNLAYTLKNMANITGNIANFVGNLSSGFGIKGITTAIKNAIRLTSLASALLIFSAAIMVLSKVSWQQALSSSFILMMVLIMYVNILQLLDAMEFNEGQIAKLAIAMAAIGAGVLMIVKALADVVKTWESTDPDTFAWSMLSIIGLMLTFAAAAKLLTGGGSSSKFTSSAFALVALAKGMEVMATAVKAFASITDVDGMRRGVTAILGIMATFAMYAAAVQPGAKVFSASLGLLAVAGAIMIIQKVVDAFGFMDADKLKQGGLALDQILIGLIGFAVLAGLAENSIFLAGAGMLALATSILIIYKAMALIGRLDDNEFANGSAAIVAILTSFVLFAKFAKKDTALSAASIMALAVGIYAIAGALKMLSGVKFFSELLPGLIKFIAIVGVFVAAVWLLKGALKAFDGGNAAAIFFVAAGLSLLAASLSLLAAVPLASMVVAMGGLVLTLMAVALVLKIFSGLSAGMAIVAAALMLVGAAVLFVGAGMFIFVLALTTLIPLLLTLSTINMDSLSKGLEVIKVVAQGLAEAMDILTASVFAFGGSLIVAGLGLIFIGVGFVAVGAGCTIAALGVSLFAGSLALLAVTISNFFGSQMLTTIGGFIDSIKEKFSGLFDHIRQNADAGTTDLKQKLIEANDAGDQYKGDEIKDKITEPVKSAPTEIAGQSDSFFSAFASLPQAGAEGYNSTSSLLSESIDGMQSDILAQLEAGNAEQGDLGSQGSLDFLTGYASNSSSASGYATKMVNSLVSAEQKGDHRGAGRKDITQFVGGMKSVDVKGTANQVGSDAVPPDKSDEAYDVGYNITMGLADGIGDTRAVQAVCNAAADAVRQAIAKAKAEAAESSPSKKTIEIGWFMSKGLAIGITKGVKEVESASKDVVAEGINAITSAMDKASSLFDANVDYTPTITPVVDLSNVAYSAAGINSMFGHTGITLDANLSSISSSIESANQNDLNLLAAIDVMSSKIEELESKLMAIQPDYERISSAVEHGASRATLGGVSLNGRELKRGLKDMGVITR